MHWSPYAAFSLAVMDVFSRYLWMRPLSTKRSTEIAQHLTAIYMEHGPPRVVQHDRGREFRGAVEILMKKFKAKIISSSPYHPQSQGKVERCHRAIRRKILYDLIRKDDEGVNWVEQVPSYCEIINNDVKEELGYRSPFNVYFGRMNNIINRPLHRCLPKDVRQELYIRRVRAASHADLRKTETRQLQMRSFARKADERYSNRMVMRGIKKNPPSVYRVGERVLVRLKDAASKVTKRYYCVECDIIRRNVTLAQYEVQFVCPTTRQKQTKWKSVANITSLTSYEEKRRRTIRQRHRDTYYLPVGSTGEMDWLDNHDFSVRYNPEPNENCQFEAIADQLSRFGILRSGHTLRAEIVRDIGRYPYLRDGSSLTSFLNNEDLMSYLRAMIQDGTHGDHITLQRCTVIFNVQFIVLSSLRPAATSIISATGRYDENIPTLFLAHLREGRGEHYLSIEGSDEGMARVISLNDRGGSDNRNDELANEHDDNGRALIDRGDRREVVEMERDDSEDRDGGQGRRVSRQ